MLTSGIETNNLGEGTFVEMSKEPTVGLLFVQDFCELVYACCLNVLKYPAALQHLLNS